MCWWATVRRVDRDGFEGNLRVRASTVGDGGRIEATEVTASRLHRTTVVAAEPGDNLETDEPLDHDRCLLQPVADGFGVCRQFPGCGES